MERENKNNFEYGNKCMVLLIKRVVETLIDHISIFKTVLYVKVIYYNQKTVSEETQERTEKNTTNKESIICKETHPL